MPSPTAVTPPGGTPLVSADQLKNPIVAVSPTGQAIIPAKFIPYIMLGWAALEAAATQLPDGKAKQWIQLAVHMLGPILAMAVPGLRRAAPMFLLLIGLSFARPVHAQQLTIGPSVPLMLVRPGDVHPVSLAPGAGISAGVDLFPTTFFGQSVHLLSLGGDSFGSIQAAQSLTGAGSVSLHVTLFETLTLLAGLDLYRSDQTGLFAGSFSSKNLFFGLGLDYAFIQRVFLGHQAPVVSYSDLPKKSG